ncbi:hypothetical protein [Bradyrhizobium sp.]|uniref:hypothetical protein n=1 Tax=Bradyrhizobium sp. TaxID=376 RepID=UPI0025BE60F8|nr:hypothetical protein [Bradyrhizobium sp.]
MHSFDELLARRLFPGHGEITLLGRRRARCATGEKLRTTRQFGMRAAVGIRCAQRDEIRHGEFAPFGLIGSTKRQG